MAMLAESTRPHSLHVKSPQTLFNLSDHHNLATSGSSSASLATLPINQVPKQHFAG